MRYANDQRFELGFDARPSWIGTMCGSIELAGNQTTVPAKIRLGLGDTRDIGKRLAPESFTNFNKCAATQCRKDRPYWASGRAGSGSRRRDIRTAGVGADSPDLSRTPANCAQLFYKQIKMVATTASLCRRGYGVNGLYRK